MWLWIKTPRVYILLKPSNETTISKDILDFLKKPSKIRILYYDPLMKAVSEAYLFNKSPNKQT